MLMLETALDRFDQAALQEMLSALPPTWAARAERRRPFDDRLRSAVGYTLLRTILQQEYGITEWPPIVTDEYGKPHLHGCPLHFSISHCKSAVVCIVEDRPVGIDVQDILHDKSDRLKARIAAPLSADDFNDRALTALWTQKEASAKLDGRGLTIPLRELPLPHHTLNTTDHGTFVMTITHNE